jgi:uncharacterized repeat protein (TIGR03806 family)
VRAFPARLRSTSTVALLLLLASCEPDGERRHLSDWGLFVDGSNQIPEDDVIPYDIISPLFSDHAIKHRFMRIPEGESVTIGVDGRLMFPEGTVLVKTFGFLVDGRNPALGERLIETRLLVLEEGEWTSYVYLWDEEENDATLSLAGPRIPVTTITEAGESLAFTYRVPSGNECSNCHGGVTDIRPLGLRLDQLDHPFDYGAGPENELDHLDALGIFAEPLPTDRTPLADPTDASAPLEDRARAYLHANCSHCHREGGAAQQSGLWLNIEITEPSRFGVCKPPAAAGRGTGGRSVDIEPGASERSIMTFRMASEEPGIKMPELPNVLSHAEGVTLITEWIDAMEPNDCMGP